MWWQLRLLKPANCIYIPMAKWDPDFDKPEKRIDIFRHKFIGSQITRPEQTKTGRFCRCKGGCWHTFRLNLLWRRTLVTEPPPQWKVGKRNTETKSLNFCNYLAANCLPSLEHLSSQENSHCVRHEQIKFWAKPDEMKCLPKDQAIQDFGGKLNLATANRVCHFLGLQVCVCVCPPHMLM